MIQIKILLILLIIQSNHGDFIQQFRPFTPVLVPPPPPCPLQQQIVQMPPQPVVENMKSPRNSTDMNFLLPFLDIDVQIERITHVMQDQFHGDIYVLHGHELFQMFLGSQEKRLSLMGYLEGSVRIKEPVAAEVISWHGHLLLVVALDDYLEIFQIRKDLMKSRGDLLKDPRSRYMEMAPVFQPMQQLTLYGKLQKLFLISSAGNEVMIVAAVNFSKLYGKIRTFKWTKIGFEPLEELTVPAISVLNVIGFGSKYLITGKTMKRQTKTILTIYEIDQTSQRLQNKQTLTVDSFVVHSVTFQKHNVLVACSSKQLSKCKSYLQMPDGQFGVFKQRTSEEFAFDQLSASSRFIMASRQNRIMIFTDHHLDCYGGFTSDLRDITKLVGYHSVSGGEEYVLLIYKTPFRLLIRVVQMELGTKERLSRATDSGGVPLVTQHKQMLSSFADQLRSFLPPRQKDIFLSIFNPQSRNSEPDIFQRFADMMAGTQRRQKPKDPFTDMFQRMVDVIEPKSKERTSQDSIADIFQTIGDMMTTATKRLKTRSPTRVNSGKVGKIQISNRFLRSPKQVLDKVSQLRQTYMAGQRGKRSDTKGPYNITLELTNHVKVHKLQVKNLIYSGDVLKGFSVDNISLSAPALSIRPMVKTHILNTTEVETPPNIRGTRQYIPDLYYDLTPSIRAKHLKVASVNGLPWSEFYEAIFLRNRDSSIAGRLVLQSQVEVEHLKTLVLNHLTVENLFNLRHPQMVNSQLVISRFFIHDLKADKVNGLQFEEDIVFSGREAYVETPVTMHHLSISGDLIVADKKIERFFNNADEMEFKQFYTNKVIINGTLVLSHVKRDKDNVTRLEIGDEEFREEDIKEKYLLKNEPQHFNFPLVFDNGKVIAPGLETLYLNDHITEDHMLTNRVNNTKPLLIVFMKAEVRGDIICRDYKSKIAEIKENIIRPGDVATITGKKRFEAPLASDDLQTSRLNHLPVSDLVFKTELDGPMKFRDSKIFDKITVRKPCFVEKGIEAMYLNNLPLEDLLNHDYHMEYIYVPHTLLASNIVFHKINGISFDDFFTKLNVREDQLILRKNLIVEGNVLFGDPLELEYINDLAWNSYVTNLARRGENSVIEGKVCFNGDLTITEELQATEVNNYNLQDILNNILMKSRPQLITGQYTFGSLKVSNLDVLSINDKPVNEFIDLSKNYTEFAGDIIVPRVVVKANLKGLLEPALEFDNIAERVKRLSMKSWRNLKVLKNVTWNKHQSSSVNTQHELLKYLYKYAVKSNRNQVITGNVKLVRPVIQKMRTHLQFPPNIDLDFIEKDAVKRNSSSAQKIQGLKNFLKPVYMKQLEAEKGIHTHFVNNIDILLFNNSLYRLSSKIPLRGPLKFINPLTIGHMALRGFINDFNTSLIYQIKNNSVLPPLLVNQLFIDNNVQVKNINHMNLEYFLENRVALNGPALEVFGFLTFENVIIENAVLLQTINNIHIDNMVFKHSTHLQTLTGHKTVTGSVELAGPAHVMRLNNRDLMESYRNTLFADRNYEFDNLVIDKATFERGLHVMRSDMKQRSFAATEEQDGQHFKQFLEYVMDNLDTNSGNILYLDYDLKTVVKWQKSDNISVDKIVLKETSRISCCEKQFLKISYSKVNQEMFLENITSNRLSAFADNVAVKAENYCKFKYRKVKSKISISASNLLKVFGMKRFVETIHVLSTNGQDQQFVVLHALDLPSLKRNEVRLFKIDNKNNSIQDWQGLTQNIGEKLKVFQMSAMSALITNGLVDNHAALTIYHFNETSQHFKLQQIIDGDYDIIEMLQLHNGTYQQLIISCHKCQRVFIYEYAPQAQPNYQIFQMLSLKTNVDKLFVFSFKNDNYMLLISESDASYYHLYKYSYIRGWLHTTYGYYPNLRMSVPLSETWDKEHRLELSDNSDSIPLMLLCNLDNCHLVDAIVQK